MKQLCALVTYGTSVVQALARGVPLCTPKQQITEILVSPRG